MVAMDLQQLITAENITFQIKGNELTAFANEVATQALKAFTKNQPAPPTGETYLTTDQVCEKLSISRVTLWDWDKKGITHPVRFGNLKRYRLSELEKMGVK